MAHRPLALIRVVVGKFAARIGRHAYEPQSRECGYVGLHSNHEVLLGAVFMRLVEDVGVPTDLTDGDAGRKSNVPNRENADLRFGVYERGRQRAGADARLRVSRGGPHYSQTNKD